MWDTTNRIRPKIPIFHGECEDITELQDKLVVNRSFDLLAHMSDEEKTEMMSELWDEHWSQHNH